MLLLEPRVFEDARGVFRELQPAHLPGGHRPRPGVRAGQPLHLAQERAARAALPGATAAGQAHQRAARRDLRRRGRSAPQLADVRQVGRLHAVGEATGAWCGCPRGFAHGFLVLSDSAEVLYKIDDFYAPRARAHHRLERRRHWRALAAAGRADRERQGPARHAASDRPNCSIEDPAHRPQRPGRLGAGARAARPGRADRDRSRRRWTWPMPEAIRRARARGRSPT